MEISRSLDTVTIKGNIKSISDYQKIKETIDAILQTPNQKRVHIKIPDSISMTSSVIGYLSKLVNDGIKIELEVGNPELIELLDDLRLTELFNVKKVSHY